MLIGRDGEIARLAGALRAPMPGALVVSGPAGVGKTALAAAAVRRSGRAAYTGGGFATLAWRPYTALRQAFGARLRPAMLDGDTLFVSEHVRTLIGDGVLVVDDVQWIDEQTAAVLGALARRVPVLACARRDDPGHARRVAALTGAGFDRVDLAPLSPADAAALVRRVRPDLPSAAVVAVVRDSGGMPLLIEELAATDTPSASLRLAVAGRLRGLPRAARVTLALLGTAGRGLPDAVLPAEGTRALLDAGLAVRVDGTLAARHALLGDAALAPLSAGQRLRLHRWLARALPAPGEAARHHLGAGDRPAAYEAAMRAVDLATSPPERASHLAVAATCATGREAAELRVRAGEELGRVGLHRAAGALLEPWPHDPDLRVRTAVLVARARAEEGDNDGAQAAIDQGLALLGSVSPANALLMRVETARSALFLHNRIDEALATAREAVVAARAVGAHLARALYVRGTVENLLALDGWARSLGEAIDVARADGDVDLECRAANNLVVSHESAGGHGPARDLAREMIVRTRQLRLAEWTHIFDFLLLNLAMHAGDYAHVIGEGDRLLTLPLDQMRTREAVVTSYAIALGDVGRTDDALALLDADIRAVPPDRFGLGRLRLARALVLAEAGDHRGCLAELPEFLAHLQGDASLLAIAAPTFAWAAYHAGLARPEFDLHVHLRIVHAVPDELAGVAALAAGDLDAAAVRFDAAADRWAGVHRRGELRCRWAAGEVARLAGRVDEARERLLAVEADALAHGMAPLVARVRRSLRASGLPRSAARAGRPAAASGAEALTPRERDVVRLAGAGLSDRAIAERLAVSQRTVESQLVAARRKLGADNRRQAAALLAAYEAD